MIYDYTVLDQANQEVSMDVYKGKVLLIVNTATGCGFTPQYNELEELYETYKDQGFEILDFPSNQFGQQAPGSDEEISAYCQMNFNTQFKQFKKVDVNGPNALPLFDYLTKEQPGLLGRRIKWNFTKFLVDREGRVIRRYAPKTNPKECKADIEACLKA
ncbi:glutathione peroxidase [Atopobacter phocae]|uniref:glutathione peroxidase n=1 Tax=Atopobacter phocae TaxID=136492 RepID=UPI0004729B68|nr:glutathione peroxidase [Atopobacter phocae]